MAILKRFDELTVADKMYCLHTLHPQEIDAFLSYTISRNWWLLEETERIMIDCNIVGGPSWPVVLKSINKSIEEHAESLAKDPFCFIDLFSKGKNQCFFLNCIRAYLTESKDADFKKAASYLFGLPPHF